MKVFIEDGFIDRYTGDRLVFPGALRLLHHILPEEFPFHPSWKIDSCHIAFWELFPTIDHRDPSARGGQHEIGNWVTVSMRTNPRKSIFRLDELDWALHPPGDLTVWDGMTAWFLRQYHARSELHSNIYLNRWAKAAEKHLSLVDKT